MVSRTSYNWLRQQLVVASVLERLYVHYVILYLHYQVYSQRGTACQIIDEYKRKCAVAPCHLCLKSIHCRKLIQIVDSATLLYARPLTLDYLSIRRSNLDFAEYTALQQPHDHDDDQGNESKERAPESIAGPGSMYFLRVLTLEPRLTIGQA